MTNSDVNLGPSAKTLPPPFRNAGRRILLSSLLRIVSLGVSVITGLLTFPFIVNALGDRIFGYWTLISTFIGYYGFFDLGIVSAVQYLVARSIGEGNEESRDRTIATSFTLFLGIGLLSSAITLLTVALSPTFIPSPTERHLFNTCLLILGLGFSISFPFRVFLGIASANLRFDLLSLSNIIITLLRTALVFTLVRDQDSIIPLSFLYMGSTLLEHLLYLVIARRILGKIRISPSGFSRALLPTLFTYSSSRMIEKTSEQSRTSLQSVFVAAEMDVGAVTHYSVPLRITGYVRSLIIAGFGLLAPVFSISHGAGDNEFIRRWFRFSTRVSSVLSAFICLTGILFGREFIDLWMGDRFGESFTALAIMLAGLYFLISQFPSISYLQGVARNRFLALVALAEAGGTVALSLALIPSWGLVGAALAFTIPTIATRGLVQAAYVMRSLEIPWRRYLADQLFWPLGVATAFSALSALLSRALLPGEGWAHIALAGSLQAAFLALGLILTLDESERGMLRSWLRGAVPGPTPPPPDPSRKGP